MNKLQLYMTMSKNGSFAKKLDINPDAEVSAWVSDLYDSVCQVDYPTAERKIFYMIKYVDGGLFVVVIRTIPGQTHGNHLASWIFIPYSLRITAQQIADTVRFISERVSASDIRSSDIAAMREHFDKAYDEDPEAPIFPASSGQSVAYRYYGTQYNATIDDLVGRYRYQTAYITYAGVLLVDVRITSDISGQDLSASPLDDMGVLLPPAGTCDRQPYVYNQPLDAPYFIPLQRPVSVVWRRDGEEDVVTLVTAQRYSTQCPLPPVPVPEPEPDPDPLPEPLAMPTAAPNLDSLSIDDLTTPAPTPEEPKYTPAADDDDPNTLADDDDPVPSPEYKPSPISDLPRRTNTYYFQMPAKKASIGSVIEFEISTPTALTESPLEGYEPTGTIREGAAYRNHLVYAGGNPRTNRLNQIIWGVAGFLIGICLMWMCNCGGKGEKGSATPNDSTEQAATAAPGAPGQTAAKQPTGDVSSKAAILYLDNNKKWDKDSLEKYPDLKGLYDDLNAFNHNNIIDTWGPKLKESRQFKNIVTHAKNGRTDKKAPKTAKGTKTYNPSNDKVITVQSYLNAIDP